MSLILLSHKYELMFYFDRIVLGMQCASKQNVVVLRSGG